jgi:hypothetical protein
MYQLVGSYSRALSETDGTEMYQIVTFGMHIHFH